MQCKRCLIWNFFCHIFILISLIKLQTFATSCNALDNISAEMLYMKKKQNKNKQETSKIDNISVEMYIKKQTRIIKDKDINKNHWLLITTHLVI